MTDHPAAFDTILYADEKQELPPPDGGPYYLATQDGFFVHKKNHWGRVIVPITRSPMLAKAEPLAWYDISLPAELIGQAWGFFRAIWNLRKSEAMVDITWSTEKGYRLFVPPQQTSGGGVKAFRNPSHYRGQIVGTIHSHCNFNAYHSGTDTHDADEQDGLHMTIGHVHEDKLDIAIMLADSKVKWNLPLKDIVDKPVEIQQFPAWWIGQVKDPVVTPTATATATKHAQQTTWHPPERKTITPPAERSLTVYQGGANDNDYGSYGSIDALIYGQEINDADLLADLEQLAAIEDYLINELDKLGLTIDFDISGTPRRITDDEELLFRRWLRENADDTPEAERQQLLQLGWSEEAISYYQEVN